MVNIEFHKVPRFDELYISRSGDVSWKGKILEPKLYGEYWAVNLGSGRTTHIHRLLAMTFIECPGTFENFVVNHKDGNKLNNSISNLEWVTYSGNSYHAYVTGLRTDSVRLLIKDTVDQSIVETYSLSECARRLGVNNSTVHNLLKTNNPKAVDGRYLVVHAGCDFPDDYQYHVRTEKVQSANFVRRPIPIKIKNTRTGEESNWDSVESFASAHGSNKNTVQKSVWKNDGVWKHFKIEYVSL